MSFVSIQALTASAGASEVRNCEFCSAEFPSSAAYSKHLSSLHPDWVLVWLERIGYSLANG